MRIPVSVTVGRIAHGASLEEIFEGYPDLERDDVLQALEYAGWRTKEDILWNESLASIKCLIFIR